MATVRARSKMAGGVTGGQAEATVSHDLLWLALMEARIAKGGPMGTALLIGITGALGCLALELGVFVLGKPPPSPARGPFPNGDGIRGTSIGARRHGCGLGRIGVGTRRTDPCSKK
jgi:hypothetical protein